MGESATNSSEQDSSISVGGKLFTKAILFFKVIRFFCLFPSHQVEENEFYDTGSFDETCIAKYKSQKCQFGSEITSIKSTEFFGLIKDPILF